MTTPVVPHHKMSPSGFWGYSMGPSPDFSFTVPAPPAGTQANWIMNRVISAPPLTKTWSGDLVSVNGVAPDENNPDAPWGQIGQWYSNPANFTFGRIYLGQQPPPGPFDVVVRFAGGDPLPEGTHVTVEVAAGYSWNEMGPSPVTPWVPVFTAEVLSWVSYYELVGRDTYPPIP